MTQDDLIIASWLSYVELTLVVALVAFALASLSLSWSSISSP